MNRRTRVQTCLGVCRELWAPEAKVFVPARPVSGRARE